MTKTPSQTISLTRQWELTIREKLMRQMNDTVQQGNSKQNQGTNNTFFQSIIYDSICRGHKNFMHETRHKKIAKLRENSHNHSAYNRY